MMIGRWRVGAVCALAVTLASPAFGPAADAQTVVTVTPPPAATGGRGPSLSGELYTAQPLSGDQVTQLDQFVEFWVARVLDGGLGMPGDGGVDAGAGAQTTPEATVTAARLRLLEPLSYASVSDDFRAQYTRAILQRMDGALDPQRPLLNRLNAIIVLSRLNLTPQLLELVALGLRDESAAVRYWSVKALTGRPTGGNQGGGGNAQQQLLAQLEELLNREQALAVLEQLFQAMVELPGVQSLDAVIRALTSRVGIHARQPGLPYHAEHTGMRAAYQKIIQLRAGGQPINPQLQALGAAATKYLLLIGQQGQQQGEVELPADVLDSAMTLASLASQIVGEVHSHFGVPGGRPPQVSPQGRNWNEVLLAGQQARDMFTKAPFNMDPVDLLPPRN